MSKHTTVEIEWGIVQAYVLFADDREALAILDSLLPKLNARNVHPESWMLRQKDGSFVRGIEAIRAKHQV